MVSKKGRDDRMSIVSYASSLASYEELPFGDHLNGSKSGQQDRIFVSIRLRPLNGTEIARNHVVDWECVSNNTIIFNNNNTSDRFMSPMAYTFNRVFKSNCPTKQVYEEGAKEVALSVLNGFNASIFAYGQTSSGKTYTMSGITEYAIADIYDYIEKHQERKFVLKFSAMEIYNEAVRDLLNADNTPLRLRDDPEKGTIVDKLIEETLKDMSHLQELLAICKAQRQIGETSMNETSSRSHQILRLTIESSAHEHGGSLSTLIATMNFIDLAGSERASQSLTAGARLKEGSHINRSLLTLGTVIRKLSKGRTGHIPYRDSKLTRILQNSLGGNAKTAIICTMSPARCHVEQSKSTLLFASCAKDVTNNAQVNIVMSDKAMVKQLQKELGRLETQLRNIGPIHITENPTSLLREKDLLIEQREKEIKELIWQRDLAQSRFESLLKSIGKDQPSQLGEVSALESSEMTTSLHSYTDFTKSDPIKDFNDTQLVSDQILEIPKCQDDYFLLDNNTLKFKPNLCHGWEEITQSDNQESEDIYKEVQCMQKEECTFDGEPQTNMALPCSKQEEEEQVVVNNRNEVVVSSKYGRDEELQHIDSDETYEAFKQKTQELQKTVNHLENLSCSEAASSRSNSIKWTRSNNKRSVLMTIPSTHWCEEVEENEVKETLELKEEFRKRVSCLDKKFPKLDYNVKDDNICANKSQNLFTNGLVEGEIIKEINIDETNSIVDFDMGAYKMGKQWVQTYDLFPETPPKIDGSRIGTLRLQSIRKHAQTSWPKKFERYRKKIIELWAKCNVPLVHRSYFFLLFKGDPSDNVYMEVELKRLYFMKDAFYRGVNLMINNNILSPSTSWKAICRERETLAKKLQKMYTKKEREDIFKKWNINIQSKQRSLQLATCLWTDTKDMKHIKESAVLIVKLMDFVQPGYAPKEMFGLSFLSPTIPERQKSSFNWRDNMTSLL